jgi:hypothetical protein
MQAPETPNYTRQLGLANTASVSLGGSLFAADVALDKSPMLTATLGWRRWFWSCWSGTGVAFA